MSRYIDADKTLAFISRLLGGLPLALLNEYEKNGIDIVRCKECKHCYVDGEQVKFNACELNHNKVQSDDWFCADGEREGE